MQILDMTTLISASVPLQWAHSGLYFLFNQGECVYVGQSQISILSRIAHHLLDKEFDAVTVLDLPPNADLLNTLEAEYIWRLAPRYNMGMPRNPYYMSKEALKSVLHISARKLNRILKTHCIQPRLGFYYDVREIEPHIGDKNGNTRAVRHGG